MDCTGRAVARTRPRLELMASSEEAPSTVDGSRPDGNTAWHTAAGLTLRVRAIQIGAESSTWISAPNNEDRTLSQRAAGISEIDKLKETVQLLESLWEAAQRLSEGSDRRDALEQIGDFQRRVESFIRRSAPVDLRPPLAEPGRLAAPIAFSRELTGRMRRAQVYIVPGAP